MKLSEIAKLVGGQLEGDDVDINGVSNLEIQTKGTIGYVEKAKHLKNFEDSEVSALIIPENSDCDKKPVIKVKNPKLAFSMVLERFSPYKPYPKKIYPNTHIEDSAKIGDNVTVMPFSVIMDDAEIGGGCVIYSNVFIGKGVKIGKNCIIKAGVKIDDFTQLGDNVIIHHNSVIGGDGFGYIQDEGRNKKIPQIGGIVIGNNVEIGACVTIDRATIGDTLIEDEVKIDNLVQIAHNVKIGYGSIVVSQVGIAGSTTVGKNCIFAGQVGIADHITIGDNVVIMAQAGVDQRKIESGSILLGTPAREFMHTKRVFASMDRLPELVKTVRELQKRMEK
jgi:UDP-3-O-[3-hydroxymyristoyl] glucosamine N-acyltransferase